MRAAVTVVGPMPSPRKKITFFASPAAAAVPESSARPSARWSRVQSFILSSEAEYLTDDAEHRGVVDDAGEFARPQPDRAEKHIGAAMALAARGHGNGRFLVIDGVADLRVV